MELLSKLYNEQSAYAQCFQFNNALPNSDCSQGKTAFCEKCDCFKTDLIKISKGFCACGDTLVSLSKIFLHLLDQIL